MTETTVIPNVEPVAFEQPATLTGDITTEQEGKSSFRVWLGTSLGTVSGGVYKGTDIIATGTGLALYVRRRSDESEEGRSVGTVYLDLSPIIQSAIAAFEKAEKESK